GLVPARRILPTMLSLEEELVILQTRCYRRIHEKFQPNHFLRRYLLRGAYRKILLVYSRRTIRPAPLWTLTRDLPTPKFVPHHPSPKLCLPVCLRQSPR